MQNKHFILKPFNESQVFGQILKLAIRVADITLVAAVSENSENRLLIASIIFERNVFLAAVNSTMLQ